MHERHLLTVAHCAAEVQAGSTLTLSGTSYNVAEVFLHPQWNDDEDQNDIAVIRLRSAVVGVAPYEIYRRNDEVGQRVTLVGRGTFATALEGEEGGVTDAQLRAATNIVDAVSAQHLELTMSRPSDNDVTALEGVGAAGDSGCPVFIDAGSQRFIAGLNAFGEGPDDNEDAVAVYGSFDFQTRVSQHITWFDGIVPANVAPPAADAGVVVLDVTPTNDVATATADVAENGADAGILIADVIDEADVQTPANVDSGPNVPNTDASPATARCSCFDASSTTKVAGPWVLFGALVFVQRRRRRSS